MTSFKILTLAQQARLDYRLMRLDSPKASPATPTLHPDNPTLPDEPDDAINQLPAGLQGLSLKVNVSQFAESVDPGAVSGNVQLTWNGSPMGAKKFYVTPVDSADFPFVLTLPEGITTVNGRHELGYTIVHGSNGEDSETLEINIDTQAPTPNGMVTVPAEVDRDGITKAYLDANGFVLVTIPDYGTKKIGDKIEAYFGTSLPTPTLIGEITRTDTTTPITFELTADKVGTEEGEKSIFYYLTDRKGNRSAVSPYKRLEVILTDPPVGLLPPDVPQADDGIDLEDAYQGVGVGIVAEYTNYLLGDQLEVTWDGQKLAPVTIPGFPFHHTVPFTVVQNGDDGEKTVTASYQIVRGTARHPAVAPFKDDIDVDLRKPGPENPDIPPGTVNPALALVTVQGAVTTDPNKLTIDDVNEDATASVLIYENYKAGDVVQLYWKGVAVPEATLPAIGGVYRVLGTEADTFRIPFVIPWATIDAGGNGDKLPVHYTIAHTLNDNIDTSKHQEVNVLIREGTVPKVEFQHLMPVEVADGVFEHWLACGSLREDTVKGTVVEVVVAGGEPQLADQDIIFTYQGYTDDAGTVVKPGTDLDVTYRPTAQEAVDGFVVKIPYEPFRLTESAWGAVSYVANVDGFPVTSVRHLVRVHMKLGSGGTCLIPGLS